MFGQALRKQFTAMGAEAQVQVGGDRFEIDIDRPNETFALRLPGDGSVTAKVLDVDRKRRQLLLDVNHREFDMRQKYLCGHDEFDWFVAALPERKGVANVQEAMEALKPQAVLDEQQKKRVKRRRRRRRKTTAYVRQGEWFFVPRPDLTVVDEQVEKNGELVRGAGKPHRVQLLFRVRSADETYVRGWVAHPDHSTLHLDVWHQVFRNTEAEPQVPVKKTPVRRATTTRTERRPVFDMKYID